jgi:(1->4)-alpha-D-glucan 1-alpha-D-glucosylmutase
MEKAMREAKVHTTWTSPSAEYEGAVKDFVARILDPRSSRAFLEDLKSFHRAVAHHGLLNSLAQTVLKLTAPGVPDTYQGTELWDFSLVDPDNRRPVDYDRRRRMLGELDAHGPATPKLARELFKSSEDGRIKLWVTSLTLRARRENPGLFSAGDYVPAEPAGERRDNVFAFSRSHRGRSALVAVSRLTKGLEGWGDTRLHFPSIPGGDRRRYHNLFTGEQVFPSHPLPLSELFATLPVAVLLSAN